MTIGQRIAQKRKELALSQEALGEQLGVSRQAIYKWESDGALPEVDKLVTLSRLFGVTVGWLLGVEEPSAAQPAPEDPLNDTQLKMVEEIAGRYLAAQPKSPWGKWDVRSLFALCGILLAVIAGVNSKIDRIGNRCDLLEQSIQTVQSSLDRQVGDLTDRVDTVLKAQSDLAASFGAELTGADLKAGTVSFSVFAVPKTFTEGLRAEFTADFGGDQPLRADGSSDGGQKFSTRIICPLTDAIALSVAFVTPDGSRQTQLLDSFNGLNSQTTPQRRVEYNGAQSLEPEGVVRLEGTWLTVFQQRVPTAAAVNAALPEVEVQSTRVGLFRNRVLVAWAESGDPPKGGRRAYPEGADYYFLPDTAVTLGPDDRLCFAAVLRDQFGRDTVCLGDSFSLSDDGTLLNMDTAQDQGSADWTY